MQRRWASLVESLINIGSGYALSLVIWLYVINPIFDIRVSLVQSNQIVAVFTIMSIVRSYIWRRIFNWMTVRHQHLNS